MKKFLLVIAFAVLAIGLFIGGVISAIQCDKLMETLNATQQSSHIVEYLGTNIAIVIGLFSGGIASCIASIASFFKSKVKSA